MPTKSEKALEAAKNAGKAARAQARKVAEAGKAAVANARKGLKESKHRRKIEAVEVLGGAVVAGSLEAYDIRLEWGDRRIPMGIVGGLGGLAAGMALKEPDLEAMGLGALAGGAAIYTNEMIRDYQTNG